MYFFERYLAAIRHSPFLNSANWVWNRIVPFYDKALYYFLGRRGLERVINKTDRILVPYSLRYVSEIYEPQAWTYMMNAVQPGDIIADIGAHIGLYTVALANRVGPLGQIFAFEPDTKNSSVLKEMVLLNKVTDRVKIIEEAVSDSNGVTGFVSGLESGSHLNSSNGQYVHKISCIRLDTFFANKNLNILKIDVEGYEGEVLKGAVDLLADQKRRPRFILIELHPFAWSVSGCTSSSILKYLSGYNCIIVDRKGQRIGDIEKSHWCWLIAAV